MELICRDGKKEDARLLFDWTNEISVRQNSLNREQISWTDHLKWLNERLSSADSKFFIFENNTAPVGQVRLDFKDGEYYLNYSVDVNYRGKGIGTLIVKNVIDKLEHCRLKALVKEENIASGKVFERLGFSESDPLLMDTMKVRVFYKHID